MSGRALWKKRNGLVLGVAVAAVAGAMIQTASVPVAEAAATPSAVPVSQLQSLINTVRGATTTYAGMWIDGNTIYVSAPSDKVTSASVAGLEPRAVTNAATMKIDVVHAKYDFAQLEKIDGRVLNDAGLRHAATQSHAALSEWYPDPETDKIVIGFTRVTAAEIAEVRAEYGSTARVITAAGSTESIGVRSASDPMPKTVRPALGPTDDQAPWDGGDIVFYDDGNDFCTSGYAFSDGTMSTAGHCGSNSFYNQDPGSSGSYEGATSAIQWGNDRIDMQQIKGSTYGSDVWAGPTGDDAEPVSGSGGVADGGTYCTDGAVTGVNCTAVVDAVDVCSLEDDATYVCDLDEASSSDSSLIDWYGDSGGPVFTQNSVDDPYAVGTISSLADDGEVCFWSDMYMAKEIFGSAPVVG